MKNDDIIVLFLGVCTAKIITHITNHELHGSFTNQFQFDYIQVEKKNTSASPIYKYVLKSEEVLIKQKKRIAIIFKEGR